MVMKLQIQTEYSFMKTNDLLMLKVNSIFCYHKSKLLEKKWIFKGSWIIIGSEHPKIVLLGTFSD